MAPSALRVERKVPTGEIRGSPGEGGRRRRKGHYSKDHGPGARPTPWSLYGDAGRKRRPWRSQPNPGARKTCQHPPLAPLGWRPPSMRPSHLCPMGKKPYISIPLLNLDTGELTGRYIASPPNSHLLKELRRKKLNNG